MAHFWKRHEFSLVLGIAVLAGAIILGQAFGVPAELLCIPIGYLAIPNFYSYHYY